MLSILPKNLAFEKLSPLLCSVHNKSITNSKSLNAWNGRYQRYPVGEIDANVACSEISPFRSNGNRPTDFRQYRKRYTGLHPARAPSKLQSTSIYTEKSTRWPPTYTQNRIEIRAIVDAKAATQEGVKSRRCIDQDLPGDYRPNASHSRRRGKVKLNPKRITWEAR